MPFINGGTWRIEIGDGQTTEKFGVIGGETSFDWSRQAKEYDNSSKDDDAYSFVGYGAKTISIRAAGKTKLPDTGLERADAVSRAATPTVNIRIVEIASAVVKYEGLMGIGNISVSFSNDEPSTWSFDLKSAATPTKDNLGATSPPAPPSPPPPPSPAAARQ